MVLGHVTHGTVRRHDVLSVLPTDKVVQVRSIQKHDDDFEVAYQGDRVGLALKNVEADELDRRYILSNDPQMSVSSELRVRLDPVRYWPSPIKEGMVLHLGHWMQFLPCRVQEVRDDDRSPQLTLTLEKPLIHRPGSRVVAHHLEGEKLRIVGTIDL